jgi:hypothetical protein
MGNGFRRKLQKKSKYFIFKNDFPEIVPFFKEYKNVVKPYSSQMTIQEGACA